MAQGNMNDKLLEAFAAMDTNHDNEIDLEEFKVGMSKIMGIDDEQTLKQLFYALDEDKSGGIKYRELFNNDHFRQLLGSMDSQTEIEVDSVEIESKPLPNNKNNNHNNNNPHSSNSNDQNSSDSENINGLNHHSNNGHIGHSEKDSLELENAEERNSDLTRQLRQSEIQIDGLNQTISQLTQEAQSVRVLEQQNILLEQEMADLKKQIEDLQSDKTNLETQMSELNQQMLEREQIILNKDGEIERLNSDVSRKQQLLSSLENNRANDQAALVAEMQDHETKIQQAMEKQLQSKLTAATTVFRRQIEDLEAKNAYLAETADTLAAENEYWKEQSFAATFAEELNQNSVANGLNGGTGNLLALKNLNSGGVPDLYGGIGVGARGRTDTRFVMSRQESDPNAKNNNDKIDLDEKDKGSDRSDTSDTDTLYDGGASGQVSRQGTSSPPPVQFHRQISMQMQDMERANSSNNDLKRGASPRLNVINSQSEVELMKSQSDVYLQSKYKPVNKQMSVDRVNQIKRSRHTRGESFVLKNATNSLLGVGVGGSRGRSPKFSGAGAGGAGAGGNGIDDATVRYIVDLVTKSITKEFDNSIDFFLGEFKSLSFAKNETHGTDEMKDRELTEEEAKKGLPIIDESHHSTNSQGSVVSSILSDLSEMKSMLVDLKGNGSNNGITLQNGDDMMNLLDKYFDDRFKTALKKDIKESINQSMNDSTGSNNVLFQPKSWWEWW